MWAMKLRIAIALLVGACLSLFRRLKVRLVSIAAIIWILAEYCLWWVRSYRGVNASESQSYSTIKHLFFLHNAAWVDIIVLAIAIFLLGWQLYAVGKPPPSAPRVLPRA